jgi:hypothetical protein
MMSVFFGMVYLILSGVSALAAARSVPGTTELGDSDPIKLCSIGFAAFGTIFFLPFYTVGAMELFWESPRLSLVSLLMVQMVLTGLVLLLGRWVRRDGPDALVAVSPEGTAAFRWRSLDGGLCIVMVLVFALIGLMLITGFPRGHEVVNYHLPIAVDMFQSGSMRVWKSADVHTFPANMSASAGFFLQFLPERAISVLNLPFLSLACFVVYGLSRLAGGDSGASRLAAAGLVSIPIVAFSSLQIGSDIGGIAFLGLGYLIVMSSPRDRISWIFLGGLCIGLAYGFKSLHLVGGGLLGLYVMFRAFRGRPGMALNLRLVRAFGHGGIFACGFLLTAGFWLLRNFIELHNPVYPVHLGGIFDLLGWARAPSFDMSARSINQFQWVRSSWEWFVYPWVEWHYIQQNFKHSSGLGVFFATFVPIAWLAGMYRVLDRRRLATATRPEAAALAHSALLVFASLAIVAVWWGLDDRQPRYVMGAIILAVPLVARLVTGMEPNYRRIMEILAVASISLMLLVVSSKQAVEFGSRFIVSKQYSRADFYEYPAELDRLPPGSTVLNLSSYVSNYFLAGNLLSNRVLTSYRAESLLRQLGRDRLTSRDLDRLAVSHIYTQGKLRVRIDRCVALEEVARLDHNPTNGVLWSEPRVVYAVNQAKGRCEDNGA